MHNCKDFKLEGRLRNKTRGTLQIYKEVVAVNVVTLGTIIKFDVVDNYLLASAASQMNRSLTIRDHRNG